MKTSVLTELSYAQVDALLAALMILGAVALVVLVCLPPRRSTLPPTDREQVPHDL